MRIIVVGSGLAGLTVAIAAAQAGHEVEILESAPQITYIGAGIQVSPNSSRVLRKLGIDKYIKPYCTEPVDLRMMRWKDGTKLVECPLKEPAETEYGSPYWHVHRADFHRGLSQCAADLGVVTHLDSRVVEIDPAGPSLTTRDGRRFIADFVIASDGLNSTCREIVTGRPSPPVPTGQMVYRVTVPTRKLEGIPEMEELVTVPRNNHWIGPHGTVLSYLLQGIHEPLLNFVFTCDVTMPEGVNQQPGTAADVREAFQGWDPRIDHMLKYVDSVLEWRLFTHDGLSSWSHGSKKLCLIGDAAHAMTPYLAQGAAMGIEDGAILGGLLEKYPTKESLPKVLQLYEDLRIGRTAMVASNSIDSRWFTQMEDGPEQEKRDAYLLSHPGIWEGHINIRSRKEFLDELFGYDAYAALEKAIGLSDRRDRELN